MNDTMLTSPTAAILDTLDGLPEGAGDRMCFALAWARAARVADDDPAGLRHVARGHDVQRLARSVGLAVVVVHGLARHRLAGFLAYVDEQEIRVSRTGRSRNISILMSSVVLVQVGGDEGEGGE